MPGLTTRWRVRIWGRVQGVWFRETCRSRARALGIAGWVANRPDGSVEAVLEGPAAAVEAMVEWCRSGPPRARVERVDVQAEEPRGEHDFRVC